MSIEQQSTKMSTKKINLCPLWNLSFCDISIIGSNSGENFPLRSDCDQTGFTMSCDHRLLYSDNPQKREKKSRTEKFSRSVVYLCIAQWCDCIVVRVTFQGSVRKKVSETLRGNERPDCSNGICPNLNTMGPRSDPIWRLFQKEKNWDQIFLLE